MRKRRFRRFRTPAPVTIPEDRLLAGSGETIDKIGGYHEVFVKEGNSMPNLPGKVGVDPFSFRWKYVGEQSMASGRQSN